MSRKNLVIAVVLGALVIPSLAGAGLTIHIPGKIFSAGATVPNLSQAFVATTPERQTFVLTQVCATRPDALRLNAGAVIGDIPLETSSSCTQFVPGIAIPPNTNINCFDQAGVGGTLRCMITGVLTE